ncbi:DUF819 family protein [Halobacillus litoralis]|uniref:DUF819 family protein n=1 Tax=Halobacillus litoralis TaxID=45668 RepID=A0A845DUV7_9BACI|nr:MULTISPECIES: DUF819 family protein [Halobacillus]MCA1022188.1 DUF819 family protein [Halobacillus litoralis]MYL21441.1 DUF819 family protein [Halobacillus litoralis]MYL30103.1 DUF819 family protein [Halobacillus halophilus]MYL37432.1 DUF819 family protein [Halobacillus litoralis]
MIFTQALIQEPMAVFAYLIAIVGIVFMLATVDYAPLKKFFGYLPPLIWMYFLPMLSTTFGIIPQSSDLYSFLSTYMLPAGLLLLMISTNVPATLKLGGKAVLVFLAGTLGVVIGGPVAFALFQGVLPDEAWRGVGALAGSWIGGSGNMGAMMAAFNTPDDILSPIILTDTLVGIGWMGVMISLANFQDRFNKWNKADNSTIKRINEEIATDVERNAKPLQLPQLFGILAIGFAGSYLIRLFADLSFIPKSDVMNTSTWTFLIITAVGILLSFTKVRKLEYYGASKIGYMGIYLFLTAIGAQANLVDIVQAPQFILMGIVWLAIHVLFIFIAARLLRAPLFFVAVGSQGNIGGTSSAPIVASVFQPALAPVGLLMGILGNVVGTYAALLCGQLAQLIAGG